MRKIVIDKDILTDPRFLALARHAGASWALGEWLRAAMVLFERFNRCAPKHAWDAQELSDLLLTENLFVVNEDEVHFAPPSYCGVKGLVKRLMTPDDLMNIWNEHCGSLSKCREVIGRRRATAVQRIQECDDNVEWENVVKWLARSPWHTGRNERGWKANFDFILKPNTRVKIVEKLEESKNTFSIEDL